MDDINIRLADPDAHQIAEKFKTVAMDLIHKKEEIAPAKLREIRKLALRLMLDPGVRQCFACSYEFYLPDSAEYFSHRVSTLEYGINVPVRLSIFGNFSRGHALILDGTFIEI